MSDIALIRPDSKVDRIVPAETIDPAAGLREGWRWVTVTIVKPAFDEATQVLEGPADSLGKGGLTRTWTVRAKTAQELDAEKDGRVSAIDALTLAVAFDHENRLRALEGKTAITAAQFRAALKARL